ELYALMEKPPYGVQKGVSSLLFVAYYLANQRSLALYESGVFCPVVSQELFEILAKRPELFTLEAFDFSGIRADLFNRYLEKLIGKVPEHSTLLDIVKPLAKFIAQLPAYTLATKKLDKQTIAVRDAFQSTQSPMTLLFKTLPEACGYPAYLGTDLTDNDPGEFLNALVGHLKRLNQAYPNLLKDFRQKLAAALKEPAEISLNELRTRISQKYAGLEHYTVDKQGLVAFILRLQNNKETDTAWLESVAAFLGKLPPDKWLLTNSLDAEYRLIEFSERLRQLALVHSHQATAKGQATLFRVVSQNGENDQIAYLNDDLIKKAKTIVNTLPPEFKNADKQLQLAIISQLLSEMN
ncbi:MAG: hypothetical protein Q7U38_18525, partial [Methylobacter sp.]|nr:hypothetical protein [Methylobacter sp.]